MTEQLPSFNIEDKVRAALSTPEPDPLFVDRLEAQLLIQSGMQPDQVKRRSAGWFSTRLVCSRRLRRPAWGVALALLAILVVFLAVGPQRVLAAFRQVLGYIPGVGIVEQSAPIRVLAEPVSLTRDGITITVTSATLTGDRTHVDYRIFGVPGSAYPNREDVIGCTQREYLRLPDGTQLTHIDNDLPPVPAGVNQAVFVLPCIFNTLPGTVPADWELPLSFVPAPPDLTVMPVIDLSPSPSPQATLTPGATALPEKASDTPAVRVNRSVTVIKEIETSDGYILVGQFQPPIQSGGDVQLTGSADIRDANGKEVAHTTPQDVGPNALGLDPNGSYWYVQFKAAGLAYPLSITFSGIALRQADPNATAEFTFDAGPNPRPGQEWTPNQDIRLAGHTLRLLLITADSRNGYDFRFQGDPDVVSASVQIEGYTPNGGGGGGGLTDGFINASLSYAQLPTGLLKVTLSNLIVTGDSLTWEGQWSPPTPRTDLPADPTPQPDLCLTVDSLAQLGPAPADLAKGRALLYEQLKGSNQWGLVLYKLDGSQKQIVVPERNAPGNWGALSPDGSQVAYSASDNGIHVVDVGTQTEQALQNASGFDLHWSPDGKQIAYVALGGNIVDSVFVVNADGTHNRQASDLSYEAIVGWSPDGAKLYFVVPYTGGAAWKVYAFDLASGVSQELFTIENGTPKFLNPTLSPDGQWIAYRGRDNSSLYLVHPDGSDTHLVMNSVGVDGIAWSSSGWLGVSLREANTVDHTLVLVKPDGCESYRLPNLRGELQGLFIP
jgi:hypothetical protein